MLIYILSVFYDNKTENTKSIIEFQSIPNNQINQGNQINIIENQNSQPINSVGTQGNNIENNLNISNEINTNVGMSEKDY